ncbi:hypothetical protein VBD025_10705 [Virgibacillus flavescens]|uniref:hypothetical protein n=1 Tax=Virgibacillus flavescens TaxID=1611422 RepID=UPI003D34469C
MKKLTVAVILSILSIILFFLYQAKINTIPSISFFPIDEQTQLTEAQTNLDFNKPNSGMNYSIDWNSQSKSDKKLYLRQDVSLLFNNGKLIGASTKWREDENAIKLSKMVPANAPSYSQAISYHHGEIHYPDQTIKSIQKMSYDELFVVKDSSGFHSFKNPGTEQEIIWKISLTGEVNQKLNYHWDEILNHFQINKEDYLIVPLTGLIKYNTEKLPGTSNKQTKQIIGQLWEGLYKNYIVPVTYEEKQVRSYVPLILFEKEKKLLYILFEINGKKERLIQQYP